jgi:hypothetical protein
MQHQRKLLSGIKMLTAGISAHCQTRTPLSIRYIFSISFALYCIAGDIFFAPS